MNIKMLKLLTAAPSRSFGRVHTIFKSLGNMGIKSYETLYESYIDPIMNYASGVWGYGNFEAPRVLQNRIMPFYFDVHKYAPVAATKLEMDWIECREKRWLNMLRLFNRINIMDNSRLPKIIYDWDISLGRNTWGAEVKHIAATLGFETELNRGETYNLTTAYNRSLVRNIFSWHLEAQRKPKLRTFVKIHDFDSCQTLVKSQLTRYQRSLLAQSKHGILPLKYETDRYQGISPENGLCKKCHSNLPEDEIHFIFNCPALSNVGSHSLCYSNSTISGITTEDNVKELFDMLTTENIESTGKYMESLFRERQRIIYAN